MRKILTILILLSICFLSKAQYQVPRGYPLKNGSYYNYNAPSGMVLFDSLIMMRTASDTLMLSLYPAIKYFNFGTDSGWYYTHGGYQTWIKFGSGGSGGSETWQQTLINGSNLTQDNTINVKNNTFEMDSLGVFLLNSGDISYTGVASSISLSASGGYIYSQSDGSNSSQISATGNTATFESTAGLYNFSNLNSITDINSISTWTSGGNLSKSTFSSVADSLQPYLITPITVGSTTYQFQDSTNTPPVSFPVGIDSVYYMVGGAGTGIFSGHNYEVALYVNGVFDSFITPTDGDWGLVLTGTAAGTWHQYNGSTWPRRNPPPWSTVGNLGGGILGSTNASNVFLQYNGVNRIILSGSTSAVRFPTMTGASAGLMGLSTTGVGSNVQVGTGLQLLAGVLSSTVSGGVTTANNGLNLSTATNVQLGGALVANTTVSGAFTMNFTTNRFIVNSSDSILEAATKHSIAATDSANVRAAVIYQKAARSFFGASTLNYWGVDSLGLRAQNGKLYGLGFATYTTEAAAKPLQQDTLTGEIIRKLIDLASSVNVTGTLPVTNGGTGLATLTANNLMVGNGTGNVTFIAPSTSGNVLTSNGTTWVSSTPTASPWSRTVYGALASTNIVQTTVNADTVVVGASLGALNGLFNVSGRAYFTGNVGIGTAPNSATYELNVTGDTYTSRGLRVDGGGSTGVTIGTFSDPSNATAQLFVEGPANASAAAGVKIGNGSAANNSALKYLFLNINNLQTSAAAGTGVQGVYSSMSQSVGTNVSGYWTGFESLMSVQSTSATAIPLGTGFKNSSLRSGSGSQKFTDFSAFWDAANTLAGATNPIVYTNYYGLRLDSLNSTTFSGSAYGIFQRDNAVFTMQNILAAKTAIGSTTSPVAILTVGGTSTLANQGVTGYQFNSVASTITDNSTANSGTVTTVVQNAFGRPTFASTGTSVTYTNGATVYIANSPANGTNVTVTNPYSLWIAAGSTRTDGRMMQAKGADVSSANDLTLGADGNTFVITGTTQINAITTTGWISGSRITLIFSSTPTVKNNTAGGANTAVLLLSGGADFSATANDALNLTYISGTGWVETGRSVN